MSSRKTFIVLGIFVVASAGVVMTMWLQTLGWNEPLTSEYFSLVKKGTVRPSNISEIKFKVACSWDGCQEFSIIFKDNGNAEYIGKKNVEKIGKYEGQTDEYRVLAGYISSRRLTPIDEHCFDAYVSTIIVAQGHETSFKVCNPDKAQPDLRDVHAAIVGDIVPASVVFPIVSPHRPHHERGRQCRPDHELRRPKRAQGFHDVPSSAPHPERDDHVRRQKKHLDGDELQRNEVEINRIDEAQHDGRP